MSKLAITAIASVVLSCLMAGSACAAPHAAISSLSLSAAWKCGCQRDTCCEPKKCCETRCCKPKCETKCCEPCCKKRCCCPAIPEYPVVCAHNHGDLERDLVSRRHAPWANPMERGR